MLVKNGNLGCRFLFVGAIFKSRMQCINSITIRAINCAPTTVILGCRFLFLRLPHEVIKLKVQLGKYNERKNR